MKFNKPFIDFPDVIKLLQDRGLKFDNEKSAEHILSCGNYYRFSGYMIPFERSRHQFRHDATFEQVYDLYEFDRKLRNVVWGGVEIIEVFTRARVAYHLAKNHGPFAHLNDNLFFNKTELQKLRDTIHAEAVRSQETFVKHFKITYDEWPDIPIWAVCEIMSFGSISKLYYFLKYVHQKPIARDFGFSHTIVSSWLHTIFYIRNLCAHHSRLWNRTLSIKPVVPDNTSWEIFKNSRDKLFFGLTIIHQLLNRISQSTSIDVNWSQKIKHLLNCPPDVPEFYNSMGIPQNWEANILWT